MLSAKQGEKMAIEAKFIEVTRVNVATGSVQPIGKQIIAISHIATVAGGSHNTSALKLMTGDNINTLESYDD
jgi:hypothetical protein